MEQQAHQHKNRYSLLLNFSFVGVIVLLFISVYGFFRLPVNPTPVIKTVATPVPTGLILSKDYLSYKGIAGIDALTLLKRQSAVVQDHSGMVVRIAGRQADSSKHEYWAFYVNGKFAQVGPAEYKTKNGDLIEWKIAHY